MKSKWHKAGLVFLVLIRAIFFALSPGNAQVADTFLHDRPDASVVQSGKEEDAMLEAVLKPAGKTEQAANTGNWQVWLLLGVAALLSFFLTVSILSWKRQQEAHRELAVKNAVIEEQVRHLSELNRRKSRFFANVSHEFRTPLTLIMGPIGQVLKGKSLPAQTRSLLENAYRNGSRLHDLVDETLELARLQSKQGTLHPQTTVLGEFLAEIAAAFRPVAEARSCDLAFRYEPDPDWTLDIDRTKAWKILSNLLGNAFKYGPEGSRVELIAEKQDQQVLIRVRDDGPGIHPGDLPHIFERYFQSARPQAEHQGGLGIGLSLSHELASLMGGRLWAESVYGQGSTFFLQLPARERARAEAVPLSSGFRSSGEAPEASFTPSGKAASEKAPLILIVEDHVDLRAYLEALLSGIYRLVVAGNGREALAILEEGAMPHLILSDITMPQMDGFELLEALRVRREWKYIPLILLTARAERDDRMRAFRTGIDDYLVKPFEAEELVVRIENALMREASRREWLQLQEDIEVSEEPEAGESAEAWQMRLEGRIRENMSDPQFGVDRLAELMEMGRTSFYRRVRSVTGLSANEYIREVRLQAARELLEGGQVTDLKTLCEQVGMRSPRYFSKLYEERFGRSPGAFF